jgi:hypothetical protein
MAIERTRIASTKGSKKGILLLIQLETPDMRKNTAVETHNRFENVRKATNDSECFIYPETR